MSFLSDIDARIKLLVMLAIIIALTWLDISESSIETLLAATLIAVVIGICLALLLGISPLRAAWASCIVFPFAGGVAFFAPLANIESWSWVNVAVAYMSGWPLIFDILFKAYVATYLVVIVMQSMTIEMFIHALSQLKVPHIFIMLFTFLYRFTDLFREQIKIMRNAARSRAPHLHGWRLIMFYGRMSGNLFVRAYERGEQIHSAMLARGYDGTLPTRG